MAARGKSLNLFLLDGEISGRIECTLSNNWSGIAYKIPRDKLNESKNLTQIFEHVEGTGVYFLFGRNKDKTQTVYVGQAVVRKNENGLLSRIREHRSKDWAEAVLFTRKDDTLGSTEVSYLEYRFYNLALDAKRYQVLNGNAPKRGKPSKQIMLELEEFIDYAKIMIEVLGHKVFEKSVEPVVPEPPLPIDEKKFSMKYMKGEPWGKPTDDGKFVIYKGSTINLETTKSCPKNVLKAREEHADEINDAYKLTSDILMTSPSAAAGFIAGAALNGNQVWRDPKGQPLKQTEKKI